jgi:hypothetical protein
VSWAVLLLQLSVFPNGELTAICVAAEGELRATADGVSVTAQGDALRIESVPLTTEPGGAEETAPTELALGYDAAGMAFALVLGDSGWSLRRQGGDVPLRLPLWLKPSLRPKVLGISPSRIWLAGPDLLALVDVGAGTVAAARLGRPRQTPIPLAVADVADLFVGSELLRCSAPGRCELLGRLPGPVSAAVVGEEAVVIAVSGHEPGLYRVAVRTPLVSFRIYSGDVVALCGGRELPAWALVRREGESVFVVVSPDTPAIRLLATAEVLSLAYLAAPFVDVDIGVGLLARARAERWPALLELSLVALRDRRPAMRAAAAAVLAAEPSSRGLAGLWLASRDPEVEVRLAAMAATRTGCAGARSGSCRRELVWFLQDVDSEVSFGARDGLLSEDPALALDGAPLAYRQLAVANLVSRAERQGLAVAQRGLELLSQDADGAVREAARRALESGSL